MKQEEFCPTERLTKILPELVAVRHDIHEHPELGFEEFRTSELIRREMTGLGLVPHVCAKPGFYVDLRPDLVDQGDSIAIRADMDCLPMEENTDLPYRSVYPGKAHKCGHDGHTTILLGTAKMLAEQREHLVRNVRLIFQPAEEGAQGGGAKHMVAEGVMEPVAEIYGLHNWPPYPQGTFRVKSGPVMAELCDFEIKVRGVGGHGGQPQDCVDPIVAASALILQVDGMARHCLGSQGGGVISITKFHSGTANNIVPEMAHLEGSMRFFNDMVADKMRRSLQNICDGIASSYGLEVELGLLDSYPLLINEKECVKTVKAAGEAVLGHGTLSEAGLPRSGSEDFAYFAMERPAAYFFLGSGKPGEKTPGCHHPDFDFDDGLIETGVRVFCDVVRRRALSKDPLRDITIARA